MGCNGTKTLSSPQEDALALKNAMDGLGTNESTIIEIITNRTNAMRQGISEEYKRITNKNIIDDLKKELSGNFEKLIIALFERPEVYDAKQLKDAMKGLGTKEEVLIEIMSSRSNERIMQIKNAYKALFKVDLEEDLKSDLSGDFLKLMLQICRTKRRPNNTVSNQIGIYADDLYKAGEGTWGTDESVFFNIFSTASGQELREIEIKYKKLSGHSIVDGINNEFRDDTKNFLIAIFKALTNPAEYFAMKIKEAIKGLGTDENTLIRIIVSMSEICLPQIQLKFKEMYKQNLTDAISSDTSGDFKKALVSLINNSIKIK